jgi:hypothetical protein
MNSIVAALAATLLMLPAPVSAQWMKSSDGSIPRTRDGEPNLSARAPKAPDGKPDLSGVWLADRELKTNRVNVENMPFSRFFIDVTADLKPGDVPFQPWAADLFKQRLQEGGKGSPTAHCKPTGVPRINTAPVPYKIVQTPRLILILYEEDTVFRQIFLDGRKPVQDPEPRWMGYSSGRWEGDTLVVDTTGFNDQSWIDAVGHPHTEALHVIERFRRTDAGHIEIEMTIDDPKAYTKPFTYTQRTTLIPDEDLLEYFCSENEKDVQLYK